jgi:hypothetical protein
MNVLTRALLVTALIAGFAAAGSAQTPPLSPAAIQAQIAALEQQILVLRAQLPPVAIVVPAAAPSLAEASAAAKGVAHTWAASTAQFAPSAHVPGAPPVVEDGASAPPAVSDPSPILAKKSETYWKARMADLTATLAGDQTRVDAARIQVKDLARYVSRDGSMVPSVATATFQANADLTSAAAAVVNDQRAIAVAEEEARRANVPAGWLRPR